MSEKTSYLQHLLVAFGLAHGAIFFLFGKQF
jgi:hypothetical protein